MVMASRLQASNLISAAPNVWSAATVTSLRSVAEKPRPGNKLDVVEIKATSPQKKSQAGYTLGVVRSLLPHLGFWAGRQVSGDGVPPNLV